MENLSDKVYDQIEDFDHLSRLLTEALKQHNEMYAQMDLVLFADAMRHVCRITRVVLNPGGHALLVGVGGSGKQSLARLAAFICGYSVYQVGPRVLCFRHMNAFVRVLRVGPRRWVCRGGGVWFVRRWRACV